MASAHENSLSFQGGPEIGVPADLSIFHYYGFFKCQQKGIVNPCCTIILP